MYFANFGKHHNILRNSEYNGSAQAVYKVLVKKKSLLKISRCYNVVEVYMQSYTCII